MIKCHFIDIFKTFNPNEVDTFRDYLNSPYFNKRKKLVELYDIIKIYYPLFTDINFTREKIFSKLYPSEKYAYGKINEGLSSLYKLSLEYIKQSSFEKNEIYPDITFLEELRKRSLKSIFKLKSQRIGSELVELKNIDSNVFLKQYLVEIENANFIILYGTKKKKGNIDAYLSSVTKIITSLTNFYATELISTSVNNFNYSKPYTQKTENVFQKINHSNVLSKLFEIVTPFNQYDSYLNLLNCYFEAINDLDNEEKYFEYKRKVFENINRMSIDDIEYHLSCLKSYCILKRKEEKNSERFSNEYQSLQETILEKKLFVTSKSEYFIKGQFFNLLASYDVLKDKQKVKNLLGYVKYLPPDDRDDMKHLTEAHYNFLSYSYEKVFNSLNKVNVYDKTIEERLINLKIRTFYEMENYIDCIERINLYKKQLRSSKMLDKKRIDSELLFLNSLEKLIKIKEKDSKWDAEYLKNKIEKSEFIPSKEWLIEKCYELYEKPKQIYNY